MVKRSDIPMLEIVAACDEFHKHGGQTPDELLASKYPVKVILARMAQMVDHGVLNYGVSLRTAWVEDRSKIT